MKEYISDQIFEDIDFTGMDFSYIEVKNVKFINCHFRGVKFTGTKFDNVSFEHCEFDVVDRFYYNPTLPVFAIECIRVRLYYYIYHTQDSIVGSFNSDDLGYLVENEGEEITGYKVVALHGSPYYAIAELRIPAYADRVVFTNNKCRASCAQVISIESFDGEMSFDEGVSYLAPDYVNNVVYKVGHMVYPDKFDEDVLNICSHGIHFYLTRQEAEDSLVD